ACHHPAPPAGGTTHPHGRQNPPIRPPPRRATPPAAAPPRAVLKWAAPPPGGSLPSFSRPRLSQSSVSHRCSTDRIPARALEKLVESARPSRPRTRRRWPKRPQPSPPPRVIAAMNATPRGGEVEAIWRRDGSGAQSPPPAGAGGHPGLQPTRDRRIHADPSSEPQPATAGQPAPPREFPVPTAQARHPAGLTGSSSSDLRMIFIPSPLTCPLLSKEALTAARGPLNLTALGRRTGRSEGVTKPQQ